MRQLITCIFGIFSLLAALSVPVFALDFVVEPSPDDRVTGYIVYWADVNSGETWHKDIGNPPVSDNGSMEFSLPDKYFFPGVEYEFWAKSTDGDIMSDDSNHITWTKPEPEPKPEEDRLPVEFYDPLMEPSLLQGPINIKL